MNTKEYNKQYYETHRGLKLMDAKSREIKEGLINSKEAARILGISVKTLQMAICSGRKDFVPYYKIGGSVRYSIEDIRGYIEEHRFP